MHPTFATLGKLLRIPWRDRLLLLETLAWLALARLAIWLVPFRRLAPFLGRNPGESPHTEPVDQELLRRLEWAVAAATHHGPWRPWCLAEAIAGKALLKRRGVASTLYLGVAKSDEGELEAHAWLRCDNRILVGKRGIRGHSVIARFADEESQ